MKICVVSYHVLLQSSLLTNIFITLATYDIPPPPSPSGSACTTPSLLAVRVVNYSWTHQVTNSSTKAWGAEMVPNQIFSLLQSGWARVPPFFYLLQPPNGSRATSHAPCAAHWPPSSPPSSFSDFCSLCFLSFCWWIRANRFLIDKTRFPYQKEITLESESFFCEQWIASEQVFSTKWKWKLWKMPMDGAWKFPWPSHWDHGRDMEISMGGSWNFPIGKEPLYGVGKFPWGGHGIFQYPKYFF